VLVVLDANVLVSAAIRTGPSHRIVQRWLESGAFDVLACPLLLGEVRDVLTNRPRLRRWIALDVAENYLEALETYLVMVDDPPDPTPTTRDRDDDYLAALARAHGAD
jgi:predicted nucleic acid-binding protein